MRDKKITVRTHCVSCGSQIEVESMIYQGTDLIRVTTEDKIHSDDPYTIVHLLCEKCDMMRGFQDEVDKEDKRASERIRVFSGKPKKK